VTLDSTSDSTPSETTVDAAQGGVDSSTPATGRKPGRRRATRSAAPPPAVTATPGEEPPAAGGRAASDDAPLADVAPTTVDAAQAGEAESAPSKPARRSRRATRSTAPVAESPAEPTQPAPVATTAPPSAEPGDEPVVEAPPARARTTRRAQGGGKRAKAADATGAPVLDVLSEFGLSAPPADDAVVPAASTEPDADALLGTDATRAKKKPAAKRSRKATAPATVAPAPEAEPVESGPAQAEAVATPAVETEAAPAEPAKKPARRSRRATSKPADAAAAPAAVGTPAASTPAAGADDAPAATDASAAAGTPAVADEPGAADASAPADVPAVAETPAEPAKKPARRARRATSKPAPEVAPPAPEPASRAAEAGAVEPAPVSPAATGGGTSTPRLATTALLFQAPDPAAAPRRPRRAQSPAGPPRHVEPSATTEPAPAPAQGTEPAPARARATAERAPRAARRSAPETAPQAPEAAAERAPEAAAEAPVELVLSGEDRAAVEEVEAIETELVSEGLELPEDVFGPADFVEDETDADADAEAEADDEADEEQHAGEDQDSGPRRRRRRGGRGRRGRNDAPREQDDTDEQAPGGTGSEEPVTGDAGAEDDEPEQDAAESETGDEESGSSRRRRRRRRGGRGESAAESTPTRTRPRERSLADEVTALKGSTRLEAKRQRRREGRDAGRRRQIITEAEFLARRESVERSMVVRERAGRTQIAVLEDGVLVEHYVSQQSQSSMAGNVYLGRVQNVLPSMEAAFIDVGKGRNAVLYAGEVNWDAAGLEGQPRRIEQALKSGDSVLVQVTKDPIGHKGARLTSQITLAGRYLVFVPGGGMTGISRKLPDTERNRLKKILKEVVPDGAGVIVRTAAEGASEEELRADVERLRGQWEAIEKKAKSASAPALLQGEPDLAIRVVRDIFNDDFSSLVVEGDGAWSEISSYVEELAPDLRERVSKWTGTQDVFTVHRVDEQLAKGMDRKVWLPSGGSLVIDRTEAMTVVDVNTGKFTGSGGTLEETVTRNNLEAAEEIVRQLRLRDIGGIIVIDFIDMVLESNRDLVLRRLVECLGRDRTKHQVAEVTSLGLVQMTRKRVGQGLVEAFSETCEHCHGRGFIVHTDPIEKSGGNGGGHHHAPAPAAGTEEPGEAGRARSRRKRGSASGAAKDTGISLPQPAVPVLPEVTSEARAAVKATLATIAAAAAHAHDHDHDHDHDHPEGDAPAEPASDVVVTEAVEVHEVVVVPGEEPEEPEALDDASEPAREDVAETDE